VGENQLWDREYTIFVQSVLRWVCGYISIVPGMLVGTIKTGEKEMIGYHKQKDNKEKGTDSEESGRVWCGGGGGN